MASQLYPQGAAHILGKSTGADMTANTLKLIFYSGSYNSAHEFVSDLTGASIIWRTAALGSKTTTNGALDCADFTETALTGSAFAHAILYKDTGSDATSPLIAYFDLVDGTFTPDGTNANVEINSSGLFSIA